jgi:hypothetical protein
MAMLSISVALSIVVCVVCVRIGVLNRVNSPNKALLLRLARHAWLLTVLAGQSPACLLRFSFACVYVCAPPCLALALSPSMIAFYLSASPMTSCLCRYLTNHRVQHYDGHSW